MKDRRGSDSIARKIMLRVMQENKSSDQILHEAMHMQARSLGIPVNWSTGDTPVFQQVAPIVAPDGRELGAYAVAPNRVCGQCKKFNVASGRKAIHEQRFAERLVRDDRWQLRHLGVPLDHIGMCDESGGTMVTCSVSNADKCPGFRAK